MCSGCGFPPKLGHWTDAGATDAGSRLRTRYARLTTVNRLLAPYRIKASDDGLTPGFQLFAPGGARSLVADLEALWREARNIAGKPVDPLSDQWLAGD